MYIGFSTRLRKASRFRFGMGTRIRGKDLIWLGVFLGTAYLIYLAFLGVVWLGYGTFWILWQLCKLTYRLFKKISRRKDAKLIYGIMLASLGVLGLPGVATTNEIIFYIITCLAFIIGGGVLMFLYFKGKEKTIQE